MYDGPSSYLAERERLRLSEYEYWHGSKTQGPAEGQGPAEPLLNIPELEVAARFIGWSSATIRKALIQERAPFGVAVQTGVGKGGFPSYAYNISPGALIRYKNGDLPTWRLNEVIKLAADGIEEILDQRMGAVAELLTARPERKRRRTA